MDWQTLPSLAALRAFEAAVTHGSYSAAARSLNVTHAAIAQHVRALEDHFAQALMQREGQQMRPTEAGQRLATHLSEGFGTIAQGVQDLTNAASQKPLRVAITHSLAENWLVPRIGAFWAKHPDIPLEILPSPKLVDMRRDGIDIALRYGRGTWPGLEAEPLVSAGHTVVAAPGYIPGDKIQAIAELQDAHWLMSNLRGEDDVWLRTHAIDPSEARITRFDTGTLVIQAVRAGSGVSVQPKAIVERDIEAGLLVALHEEAPSDLAYYIVRRPGPRSDRLRTLLRWLKAQVQTPSV